MHFNQLNQTDYTEAEQSSYKMNSLEITFLLI